MMRRQMLQRLMIERVHARHGVARQLGLELRRFDKRIHAFCVWPLLHARFRSWRKLEFALKVRKLFSAKSLSTDGEAWPILRFKRGEPLLVLVEERLHGQFFQHLPERFFVGAQ